MPSKTAKQARFMAGCAANPTKMKGKCPPAAVAKEFAAADRGSGKAAAPRKRGRG